MVVTEFEAHALIDTHFWPNFRPPVRKWLMLTNNEAINMLPPYCFQFGFHDQETHEWRVLVGVPDRENVQLAYPVEWRKATM